MRDSHENIFSALQVRDSDEHGIFLAQVDTNPGTGAAGNTFTGLNVSGSGGAGLRANDPSVVDTLLDSAQLFANDGGCVSESDPGQVTVGDVICR